MAPGLDAYVALAGELAEAAGAICRRYFRTPIAVDDKPDFVARSVTLASVYTALGGGGPPLAWPPSTPVPE